MAQTTIGTLCERYLHAHNVEGLEIPTTLVKFYTSDDTVPPEVSEYEPEEITLTSC